MTALRKAIQDSAYIYTLQDDWDGEGSAGYSEDTWRRMEAFLMSLFSTSWALFYLEIGPPKIVPGPDRRIDLHWKTMKFEMLLGFPHDREEGVGFYADDYGKQSVKGSVTVDNGVELLAAVLFHFATK